MSFLILLLMASRIFKTSMGSLLMEVKSFFLSTLKTLASPSAIAVAERESLSKRAISPKISPGSRVAISRSPVEVFFVIFTLPD